MDFRAVSGCVEFRDWYSLRFHFGPKAGENLHLRFGPEGSGSWGPRPRNRGHAANLDLSARTPPPGICTKPGWDSTQIQPCLRNLGGEGVSVQIGRGGVFEQLCAIAGRQGLCVRLGGPGRWRLEIVSQCGVCGALASVVSAPVRSVVWP